MSRAAIREKLLENEKLKGFLSGKVKKPETLAEAGELLCLSEHSTASEIEETFKVLRSDATKNAFKERLSSEGEDYDSVNWSKRWSRSIESLGGTQKYFEQAAVSVASPTSFSSSFGTDSSQSTTESPYSPPHSRTEFSASSEQQTELPQYASINSLKELRDLLSWVKYYANTEDHSYASARTRYVQQLQEVDLSGAKFSKIKPADIAQLREIGRDNFPQPSSPHKGTKVPVSPVLTGDRTIERKVAGSPKKHSNEVAHAAGPQPPLIAQITVENLAKIVNSYKSSATFFNNPGPELGALRRLVNTKWSTRELYVSYEEVKKAIENASQESGYKASRLLILDNPDNLKKDKTGVSKVVHDIGEAFKADLVSKTTRRTYGGPSND